MSVGNEVPKSSEYIATGSATEFTYEFYAPVPGNVYATVNGVAVETGYTVTPIAGGTGGTLKFNAAPSSGAKVVIQRSTPIDQEIEFSKGVAFDPSLVESALDKQTMIMQEFRGGTVKTLDTADYASSAGFASSAANAGYAGSAGELVSGSTVGYAATAGAASNADYADYASSAGRAGFAVDLDATKKSEITGSAVSAAVGSMAYTGPFALKTAGSGSAMTAGMNSGYVYAGGSQYPVSAFDNDHVAFNEGDTLYLTLLSSGGAISSGLVTSPSGASSGTVIVRIASRFLDSEETEQLQFGDITTVPWGLSSGGGGGAIGFPNYDSTLSSGLVLDNQYTFNQPFWLVGSVEVITSGAHYVNGNVIVHWGGSSGSKQIPIMHVDCDSAYVIGAPVCMPFNAGDVVTISANTMSSYASLGNLVFYAAH